VAVRIADRIEGVNVYECEHTCTARSLVGDIPLIWRGEEGVADTKLVAFGT
jgi:hypothetical protein